MTPLEAQWLMFIKAFAVLSACAFIGGLCLSLLWSALAVLAQSGRVRGEPVPDYDKLGRAVLKQDAARSANLRKWE